MKKILVYGVYNSNNLGDDLMQVEINDFLNREKVDVDYFDMIDKNNYFDETKNYNYIDNPIHPIRGNKFKRIEQLIFFNTKKYKKYDAIIFMGGGYTYEKFGKKNLIKIYWFIKKIKKRNKTPIYFTGQTIGPALTAFGETLLLKIYRLADCIYVREKFSYIYLKKHKILCNLTGDDAFLLLSHKSNSFKVPNKDNSEKFIIFNYKVFPTYNDKKNEIFSLYCKIAKELNCNVIVVPFRNCKDDNEYKINKELNKYLNNNGVCSTFKTFRNEKELMSYFESCEGVVGTAYHSIALALMFNKKVIAFYSGKYYKNKIFGLLDLYDLAKTNSYDLNKKIIFSDIIKYFLTSTPDKEITNKIANNVYNEWNNILEKIRSIDNGNVKNKK